METLQQLTLSLNIGVKGGLKVWTGSGSILAYISWSKLLVCSIADQLSTCSSFCLSTWWNIRSSKMILIRMMKHPAWQEISSSLLLVLYHPSILKIISKSSGGRGDYSASDLSWNILQLSSKRTFCASFFVKFFNLQWMFKNFTFALPVCLYEKRYPFAITDATPSTTQNEVSLPFAELLISTLRKHQLMMS